MKLIKCGLWKGQENTRKHLVDMFECNTLFSSKILILEGGTF